jgi:hypothetical protein
MATADSGLFCAVFFLPSFLLFPGIFSRTYLTIVATSGHQHGI